MKPLKSILTILLCVAVLLLAVFLLGRCGWKLGGFSTCESAGIEQVDNTLYVGFKFSGLFGIFETGDSEYPVWTTEDAAFSSETGAVKNGIYVRLERDDVYSVDWHFENQSGGESGTSGSCYADIF